MKAPALTKFLWEYGSADKIDKLKKAGKEPLTVLLECAMPIGYLVWVSLRESLALLFEKLDFSNFIDKGTMTVDKKKLVAAVKGHTFTSGNIDRAKRQALSNHDTLSSLEQIYDSAHDPWHVCRGHDLMAVLSIGLCKVIGTCQPHDVKPDMLERILRLSFEFSYFRQTQLYQAIQNWEKINQPFLVLLHLGA